MTLTDNTKKINWFSYHCNGSHCDCSIGRDGGCKLYHIGDHSCPKSYRICSIPGCGLIHLAFNFCRKHYRRYKMFGDGAKPTCWDARPAIIDGDIALLPLGLHAKDGYATVDKEFAHLDQHKWHLGTKGYPIRNTKGKNYQLHGDILPVPVRGTNLVTDHINRNKLDNRKSNLRYATYRENVMNRDWDSFRANQKIARERRKKALSNTKQMNKENES